MITSTKLTHNRATAVCNAVLVTQIFCYRYSITNNFADKYFSTKFGKRFSNLLLIKCTKSYPDSFRVDVLIVQCLGGYFFPDTASVYTSIQ